MNYKKANLLDTEDPVSDLDVSITNQMVSSEFFTSWLLFCAWHFCPFVNFPSGVLGQM